VDIFGFLVHNKVQRDGSIVNVRTLFRIGSLVKGECIRREEAYGKRKRKREKEKKEGPAKQRERGRESRNRGDVVPEGSNVAILIAMLPSEDTLPKSVIAVHLLIAGGHEPGINRGPHFWRSFPIFPSRRNTFVFGRSSGLIPIMAEFEICGVVASLCRVSQSWNRVTFAFSRQRVPATRHPHTAPSRIFESVARSLS
jgi:hypothetical protein